MFCDKTLNTFTMYKVITRYLRFIYELYYMIDKFVDMKNVDKGQVEKIRKKVKEI